MTMENQDASQDNSVNQITTEEGDTTEGSKEEEIDWKAKFEESEARALKAENDKKAIQGARGKQADQDSLLLDISTRLDSSEKATAALIKALAADDTANLGEELNGIQSEAAQSRANTRFQSQYQSIYAGIEEDSKDDEGNVIINFETDPRLESFRQDVIAGFTKGSIADIVNALPQFHRILRKIERENAAEAVSKAKEEAEESSKSKLRKAGLGDHDLGSAAAGGEDRSKMSAKEMILAGLEKRNKN